MIPRDLQLEGHLCIPLAQAPDLQPCPGLPQGPVIQKPHHHSSPSEAGGLLGGHSNPCLLTGSRGRWIVPGRSLDFLLVTRPCPGPGRSFLQIALAQRKLWVGSCLSWRSAGLGLLKPDSWGPTPLQPPNLNMPPLVLPQANSWISRPPLSGSLVSGLHCGRSQGPCPPWGIDNCEPPPHLAFPLSQKPKHSLCAGKDHPTSSRGGLYKKLF